MTAAAITHHTQPAGSDSGDGKVSKNAWTEGHDLTGTIAVANLPVGTTGSDVAAGDHGHTIGSNTITEAMLSIADNTTKDVSTSAHGFVPKAPNDPTKFFRGDGTWAQIAGSARLPIQEKGSDAGSASSHSLTLAATPTAGSILIAICESEGSANVSSIAQTNVTWTKLAESTASTTPHIEIWKGVLSASPGTGITATWGSATYSGFMVQEWSGLSGTLDQSASRANTSGYIPTITPTNPSALVISAASENTYGAGFKGFNGPYLLTTSTSGNGGVFGCAFGFPGIVGIIGSWSADHGASAFSFVTVSIT